MSLLEVDELRVRVPSRGGWLTILDGVSFRVETGEVFGLAGESGSGKTMAASTLLGLLPTDAHVEGRMLLNGHDLLGAGRKALRSTAGKQVGMVFQNPMSALHPMLSIGDQLTEHMRRHLGMSRRASMRRAAERLDDVRIPDPEGALKAFPHQFSGGMRQRIAIAMALACDPPLLVADEPTTALDVTVQAGILRLLDRQRCERGLSVILISHDLGVLSSIADRVTVMYAGRIVESGGRADVFRAPRHPYTHALLGALPHPESHVRGALKVIPGGPPAPGTWAEGCVFNPRCAYVEDSCRSQRPALREREQRLFACDIDPLREGIERAS